MPAKKKVSKKKVVKSSTPLSTLVLFLVFLVVSTVCIKVIYRAQQLKEVSVPVVQTKQITPTTKQITKPVVKTTTKTVK